MKLSFKNKLIMFFLLLLTICSCFVAYVVLKYHSSALTTTVIIFSMFIISTYFIFVLIIRKHMLLLLTQLSNMISALIDKREDEVFSVLNDDMLSKLQSQVIKLSGILNMQNKRLKKEHDEIKSLISDISHQLKTPVANLEIYCGLLQDASISNEQREDFTNNIQSQLKKLSFLMESMIKMSRLESGIIVLNPQLGNLNETCLTAIKQVYQKALKKDIEVSFAEKGDILIKHDWNWIAEALFNILDNAVKYTKSGGKVTVSIEKYEMFARVDIIDSGSGLLETEINDIFKRFYRGKNVGNEEGVGIGLYLTREIITKQDGYIKVYSKKDRGSTFSVFLPLL